MASGILAEGGIQQAPNTYHIRTKIQYRQGESSESGKVVIQARMYYEWDAGADQTFSYCNMKIYTGNYPGEYGSELVLDQDYSWVRTYAAGTLYTDWFTIPAFNNLSSITLYARVSPAYSNPLFWSVNVTGIKNSYTLYLTSDAGCNITANRLSSGVGGTVSLLNGQILYDGDSVKFTANANANYEVRTLELKVGSGSYTSFTSGNTHTVSDHTYVRATSQVLASNIGATDANIGSVSTVTITKYNNEYCHSLQYSFGALSGYIAENGSVSNSEVKFSGTSVAFTVPNDFYAQIPNAKTGTCTITCRTYTSASSGTVLGAPSTCSITITASEATSAPVVQGSVIDTNTNTVRLTGSNTKLVRFLSQAQCTITATARNSATIQTKSINGTEVAAGQTTMVITGDNLISPSFVFKATDSRGYTTQETATADMLEYIKLTCNPTFARTTPTSGGVSLTFNGNMYTGEWRQNVSNTIAIKYHYREVGAATFSSWITISSGYTVQTSRYSTTAPITLTDSGGQTDGFDYTKSYEFEINVTDGDGQYTAQSVTVSAYVQEGIPVFDWGKTDFRLNVPLVMGSETLTEALIGKLDGLMHSEFRTISGGATTVFDVTQKNGFIVTTGSISDRREFIWFHAKSDGTVDFTQLRNASGVTVSTGTSELQITNGPSSYLYILLVWF